MITIKSVSKNFNAKSCKPIDDFVNDYLAKYEVAQIIKVPLVNNNYAAMNVTIIYNEDIIDDLDKTLLKEIIELDNISINNTTNELSIGYNHAYKLIKLLEELNIISSKKDGRKLLIDTEKACEIIDNYSNEGEILDEE